MNDKITYNGIECVDVLWYTQLGGPIIGIVTVKEIATGKFKRYIGSAGGFDVHSDTLRIMSHGAKFHSEFLPPLVEENPCAEL